MNSDIESALAAYKKTANAEAPPVDVLADRAIKLAMNRPQTFSDGSGFMHITPVSSMLADADEIMIWLMAKESAV